MPGEHSLSTDINSYSYQEKSQEKKLVVAEMKMLRWMTGVTMLDRIRNERIRGTANVGEISKKVQKVSACIEKISGICGQESDGDVGTGKNNERKIEAEMV